MNRMTPPRYSLSPKRQELRKRMLTLLITTVVVHSVVIGIYYGLHMPQRTGKAQQTFIAVWVVLMLAVVVPQMKGIRKLRRGR
jgi:heme/copper-type cytochrome/quinol oxidase subunit 4